MLHRRFGHKWSHLFAMYGVCFVLGGLIMLLPTDPSGFGQRLGLVVVIGIPGLLLTLLVLIALHELGHLVAAKAVGMDVSGFCVGPFRWLERNKQWTFSWYDDMRIGGFVLAVQRTPVFNRRQYLYLYAGGPLGSLIAFAVSLAVFVLLPGAEIVTAPILAFAALFVLTLLPVRSGGFASDGHWILSLLFRPQDAEHRLATARLNALAQQDVPASEWPEEIVASLRKVQGKTIEAVASRIFEMSYAVSTGDPGLAIEAADSVEEVYKSNDFVDPTGILRAAVYLDVALVRVMFQKDAVRGRAALASTGPVPENFSFVQHEVMAYVFAIEGEPELSRQAARNAVESIRKSLQGRPRVTDAIVSRIESFLSSGAPVTDAALQRSRSTPPPSHP